ncbi:MAG: sugar transferase, partial [Acidimicrobiia bacterium]
MYRRAVLLERLQLAALDAAAVFGCALAAVWLRHGTGFAGNRSTLVPWPEYLFPALLATLAYVATLYHHGLYGRPQPARHQFVQIAKAATMAAMAVLALSFFYRGYSYSRASLFIFYLLSVPALLGTRLLNRSLSRRLRSSRSASRRVIIVGFGSIGRRLGSAILDDPAYYTLVGFLDDDPAPATLEGVPVLGTTGDLRQVVTAHDVDEVILAMPSAPSQRVQELIGTCMEVGADWKLVPNLCDLMYGRIEIDSVSGLPVVGLRGSRVVGINWALKRGFDIVVAGSALWILGPVLLAIAATIRLTSPGPVLYRQTRVGQGGRPFTLFKFRSMHVDSDARVHEQYTADWIYGRTQLATSPNRQRASRARSAGNGPPIAHKIVDDSRITSVGRFLRATSLDELPQLWNVLRGEMSVVGPRPPIPYEVER